MSGQSINEHRGRSGYDEQELLLGMDMMDKLERITEMMLYFLDKQKLKFTYMLMRSDYENFDTFLKKQKRNTDVLIPLLEKGLFVIVCQETDIEGGYKFSDRLIRLLDTEEGAECLSCNVMTVSTTHYNAQHIIFKLLDSYHTHSLKDINERLGKIEFQTLS